MLFRGIPADEFDGNRYTVQQAGEVNRSGSMNPLSIFPWNGLEFRLSGTCWSAIAYVVHR